MLFRRWFLRVIDEAYYLHKHCMVLAVDFSELVINVDLINECSGDYSDNDSYDDVFVHIIIFIEYQCDFLELLPFEW